MLGIRTLCTQWPKVGRGTADQQIKIGQNISDRLSNFSSPVAYTVTTVTHSWEVYIFTGKHLYGGVFDEKETPAILFSLECCASLRTPILRYMPTAVSEYQGFSIFTKDYPFQILDNTHTSLTQVLLFGNLYFDANDITKLLNSTINFRLAKRIDGLLLWNLRGFFVVFLFSCFLFNQITIKRRKNLNCWGFLYLLFLFSFLPYFRYFYLNSIVFNVVPAISSNFDGWLVNVSVCSCFRTKFFLILNIFLIL